MNTNSKRLGIYLAIMLLTTAVATTLKTIACITSLNYTTGFFTDKSLVNVANAIVALTAIGMFSYLFTAERISLKASFSTAATYVPTGVLGVATAFLGANLFSYVLRVSNYSPLEVKLLSQPGLPVLFGVLSALLSFLSIAHHFLNAFTTESKSTVRAYFAIATITFFAFYAILIYLDSTLSVNDHSKTLRQTTFLFGALFFLYEARISIGREMWRIYTAFGLVAASLSAYTAIPAIITYYVKGFVISSCSQKSLASLSEYVLLIALFIFIMCRLYLTSTLKEIKENKLIALLDEYAKQREISTNESFERYQDTFAAKQLSIFDLYGEDTPSEASNDEVEEEIVPDEETEEYAPTISDDAIYEAIFGKMPERLKEEEEIVDDRAPEEIAEDLLQAVNSVLNDTSTENEEEK